MEQTQKTFRNLEKNSAREQRLVFENANNIGADASSESDEKGINLDLNQYSNEKEFVKELNKTNFDEERKKQLLANARNEFAKRKTTEKKQSREKNTLAKIEELKNKKKKQQKIAESTVESFQKGYLETVEELREDVRAQIEELGIKFDEKDEKVAKEFIVLEQMIWQRVESLLDKNKYTDILNSIEQDKKRAKDCYEGLGKFFRDEKKLKFLKFLKKREIPAKVKMDINSLLVFSDKYEHGKEWNENIMMIGIVRSGELHDLELVLGAVEKLYSKWDSEEIQKYEDIENDLADYEKRLEKLNSSVEISSKRKEFQTLLKINSDLSWNDLKTRQKVDFAQLKKLLTDDDSQPNLRLARAFLDGNEKEIKLFEETLAEVEKNKESEMAIPKTAETVSPTEKGLGAEEKGGGVIHETHADHGPTAFDEINKKLQQFFTANGKITWYSLNDIAGAFKLIKESWEKHTHSKSEDKRGPLAEGMLFWRPEISRRVELQDQLNEKSRANELRDHYKNKKHEELLAELNWSAPKDRRRIILEVIADRGNLRMSDKKLIGIICRDMFSDEDWKKADEGADYTRMRETFKDKIDAPHTGFIGEIGYADELFNKQGAGSETAAASGKKLSSSSETVSIDAELGIFDLQRQKTYHGGSEGEAELVGMIETMVARGNAYSNNGSFNKVKIKTEKGEEKVKENSNQGLVGLMMIDAYLRGNMSRDQLGEIGKKHESGFNPYSCTSDVIANHNATTVDGKKISRFEKWGWIKEKDGGRGHITELGKSEIINFFNTRNARAEIEKEGGGIEKKLIHIAIDSGTYKAHSGRHTTINSARNQTIKVGDKLMSYLVKKSAIGLFESATKLNEHEGHAILTEMRDITSLIKSGVEDFVDGAEMMEKNERWQEKFTGKEVIQNENGEWANKDGIVIPRDKRVGYGEERMKRGRDILVKMLHNLWQYREDREVTQTHAQYNFYERDEKTGLVTGKKQDCNLKDFIEKSLGKWGNTSEYGEIMEKVNRLYDEKQVLTSDEAEEASKFPGGIKDRADFDRRMKEKLKRMA
ncbi:hypothetical protein KAI54_04060 [Candidatus Gracilibacteria bacterium]|nr:hypothetical protein [Candidatus Gracilibacteria bacterium]